MREAVHGEGAADATPPVAPAAVLPRREPRRWMVPVAAAIAGALVGGYAMGYRTTGGVTSSTVPAQTPAITVSGPPSAFPVPAPTRVIQLEFHPDTTAG